MTADPETKAAFRRLWFWLRMTAAAVLYGWAIRIVPVEGFFHLLGLSDDLPEWTRASRKARGEAEKP